MLVLPLLMLFFSVVVFPLAARALAEDAARVNKAVWRVGVLLFAGYDVLLLFGVSFRGDAVDLVLKHLEYGFAGLLIWALPYVYPDKFFRNMLFLWKGWSVCAGVLFVLFWWVPYFTTDTTPEISYFYQDGIKYQKRIYYTGTVTSDHDHHYIYRVLRYTPFEVEKSHSHYANGRKISE